MNSRLRRGYTLVEMLVVVTILIMLVAAALPVAKKMMDGSQVREASRQLSSYWQMAKARALNTGRPCGIYFPFPTPPLGSFDPTGMTAAQIQTYWPVRQVTQMQLAEIPPPYSGGTSNSRGRIMFVAGATPPVTGLQFVPIATVVTNGTVTYVPDTGEMAILSSLINVGETFLVRFDYRGPWFICQRVVDSSGNPHFNYTGKSQTGLTFAPQNQSNYQPPAAMMPAGGHPGFKYQIVRMPRPIGNPLELPRGTCIDITYSGVGNSSRQFPPPPGGFGQVPNGLIILLTPNGGIDSMFVTSPTGAVFAALSNPIASLYFLLGKVEKVPADSSAAALINPVQFTKLESSNLADPNSLWVVLNRGTGQVTTAENMPPLVDPTTLTSSNVLINGQSVPAPQAIGVYCTYCRQAATQGEQMGGR